MNDYHLTLELLGLPDQNLPVFKQARQARLNSIEKMLNMINVSKRLSPSLPQQAFRLDPIDPEWEDKMLYPRMDYGATIKQLACWVGISGFYAYNWNVICGNRNLRLLKLAYPFYTLYMFQKMYYDYSHNSLQVKLFDNYVNKRSVELFEENRYLFDTEGFKKFVYFQEDLKETLEKVHREANDHKESDFADSELLL